VVPAAASVALPARRPARGWRRLRQPGKARGDTRRAGGQVPARVLRPRQPRALGGARVCRLSARQAAAARGQPAAAQTFKPPRSCVWCSKLPASTAGGTGPRALQTPPPAAAIPTPPPSPSPQVKGGPERNLSAADSPQKLQAVLQLCRRLGAPRAAHRRLSQPAPQAAAARHCRPPARQSSAQPELL
jgi:hypothetical protein